MQLKLKCHYDNLGSFDISIKSKFRKSNESDCRMIQGNIYEHRNVIRPDLPSTSKDKIDAAIFYDDSPSTAQKNSFNRESKAYSYRRKKLDKIDTGSKKPRNTVALPKRIKRISNETKEQMDDSLKINSRSHATSEEIIPKKRLRRVKNDINNNVSYEIIQQNFSPKSSQFRVDDADKSIFASRSDIPTCTSESVLTESTLGGEEDDDNKSHPILPENGFYVITKKHINECPNCYDPIDPKNMIFNTSNWVISTSCKYCSLVIYFVFEPLDDAIPKVTMLTHH